MTPILYAKLGGALALIVGLFMAGYHFGGLSSKAAIEGFQASQAENTAKAVLAERVSAATELARVNTIIKGYQDAPINPATVSLGSRVLQYARVADCPLSVPSANTASPGSASPQPRGDGRVEQAVTAVFEACAQDAAELTALQAVWPR